MSELKEKRKDRDSIFLSFLPLFCGVEPGQSRGPPLLAPTRRTAAPRARPPTASASPFVLGRHPLCRALPPVKPPQVSSFPSSLYPIISPPFPRFAPVSQRRAGPGSAGQRRAGRAVSAPGREGSSALPEAP